MTACRRLHDDALDLVVVKPIDAASAPHDVPSPAARPPSVRDQRLQASSFWRETSTASCVATTTIVDALKRDQSLVGCDVAVAGEILEHGRALAASSPRPCPTIPNRMPGTDIGPTAGNRHERGMPGLLRRIINRNSFRKRTRFGITSVTKPRSRPALVTASLTACTLSTLRYSSSRTAARRR